MAVNRMDKPYRIKKLRWQAVMAVVLACGIAACGKKESPGAQSDSSNVAAKVAVEVAKVTAGNVPEQLSVTGHTEATQREKIVAPIAGKLLVLNGLEGSYVKSGELVATIQSKEAQSSEEGARVMLEDAKTPTERAQAERMVALAKKDQNSTEIHSQLSGLIATRSANPGEFVAENQELLSVIALSDIVFVAEVPLFEMPRVRIGEPAQVLLPTIGSSSMNARVFAIKPGADSTSQTARVIFEFRNVPSSLVPALRTGIAGTATITFDVKHHAMLVPKSAVIRNDETNEKTVVTFGEDSLAKSITVETGPELDTLVSVMSDELKPGMNVITVGNYALADSTRITLDRSGAEAPVKADTSARHGK